MRKKAIKASFFWVVLLVVWSGLVFSGCRVGLGIVTEVRLGVIYFVSPDPTVFGELYLDGAYVGWLEPLGKISRITTLDFPHQVDLHCGFCGKVHTQVFEPPFQVGEELELVFSH